MVVCLTNIACFTKLQIKYESFVSFLERRKLRYPSTSESSRVNASIDFLTFDIHLKWIFRFKLDLLPRHVYSCWPLGKLIGSTEKFFVKIENNYNENSKNRTTTEFAQKSDN